MAQKNIMLVCSAGMSTSMLVQRMQKAANDRGIDVDIFAKSASEADNVLESKNIDVLLLGPQVRFMQQKFAQKLEPKGIPCEVIKMTDYGLMNGEGVLDTALEMIGDK